MREARINVWDGTTGRHSTETIHIILGPPDGEDGFFLAQRSDGSFWTYTGSPHNGWFGGNLAPWAAKEKGCDYCDKPSHHCLCDWRATHKDYFDPIDDCDDWDVDPRER